MEIGFTTISTQDYATMLTIHDWAYDDTGAVLPAGVVPEPASTGMGLGALALGAAGLRRWRKTRQRSF